MFLEFAHRTRSVVCALAVSASLLVAGCVTNHEDGNPPGWKPILPAKDPAVARLVPKTIRERGVISIGTNPPFAPAEFKDSNGKIIGFEMDLAHAIASTMGLKLKINDQDFSMILPAVSSGTIDFGASGFTDNAERRKTYDFVDFLMAGIQWAAQPGHPIDPNNACGLTVAVQRNTVSDTDDVRAKSKKCVAEGRPEIQVLAYDSSDTAATALVLGRAQAFSADSPVTAYAIERADGKMVPAGKIFDSAPYGWPVPKGSPLAPALAAALQHLIDTGDYQKILSQWGITQGLVTHARINGK